MSDTAAAVAAVAAEQPEPTTSTTSRIPYYIESRKDNSRITYVIKKGTFVMKKKTEKPKYNQSICSVPFPGDNTYKLFVFEVNASGNTLEGSKFLDFNPHSAHASLISSESSTGPSQKWDLEERENCAGAWLIKSCNGKYLKNNGSGKPISVTQVKKPSDLDNKSFHWILTPCF